MISIQFVFMRLNGICKQFDNISHNKCFQNLSVSVKRQKESFRDQKTFYVVFPAGRRSIRPVLPHTLVADRCACEAFLPFICCYINTYSRQDLIMHSLF